jgi:hypothetical protein
MTSTSDGDSSGPEKLTDRISRAFARTNGPRTRVKVPVDEGAAAPEVDGVLPVAERRAAMHGLSPIEVKWSKGGLFLSTAMAILLPILSESTHRTSKVDHKAVAVTPDALLLGGAVLLFCVLGFYALWRRKRSLVAFSLFICGFAFTIVFAPLGFALIVLGGWLLLRAYRIQKYGTPNAKQIAKVAGTRPPRPSRRAMKGAAETAGTRKAPTANKRYTPKAPPRKKIPKPVE